MYRYISSGFGRIIVSAQLFEDVLAGVARESSLFRPLVTPCLRDDCRVGLTTMTSIVGGDAGLARRIYWEVTLCRFRILTGGLIAGGVLFRAVWLINLGQFLGVGVYFAQRMEWVGS